MGGICKHRIADLFDPVRSVMPCFMNIMRVTGYGIHFASGRLKIHILIGQILQLRGANKGKIRRIEEKHSPLSQNVRLGNGFEGAFMIGLYGKFSDFFINERHG